MVLTLLSYPYVYLPVVARLRALAAVARGERPRARADARARCSARSCSRRSRGAITAGSLLVFLYVVSDFGAVSLMRYDTLTRAHLRDPAVRSDDVAHAEPAARGRRADGRRGRAAGDAPPGPARGVGAGPRRRCRCGSARGRCRRWRSSACSSVSRSSPRSRCSRAGRCAGSRAAADRWARRRPRRPRGRRCCNTAVISRRSPRSVTVVGRAPGRVPHDAVPITVGGVVERGGRRRASRCPAW